MTCYYQERITNGDIPYVQRQLGINRNALDGYFCLIYTVYLMHLVN